MLMSEAGVCDLAGYICLAGEYFGLGNVGPGYLTILYEAR